MVSQISASLSALEECGLRRALKVRSATGGVLREPEGELLNFSSNDYLNLSHHPQVIAAAKAALDRWGTGATASRLMSGHLALHEELEAELAAWTGRESALVFGSGFLTNLGVVTALTERGTVIFEDRLNHASLLDGARLSGARLVRYRHRDPEDLARLLSRHAGAKRKLVVTDSLFSMDGDLAPLLALGQVCRKAGAWLIVDEAHAMGVFGERGGGCALGLPEEAGPFALTGTFSKSLGGYGGFVAGSALLRDLLVNRARSFIYSTGLPPASAAGALAAIRLIRQGRCRFGDDLLVRARGFRQALAACDLDSAPSNSQIVPVVLGENRLAMQASQALLAQGVLCTAVRPPTVPAGTARLRFSVTLAHSPAKLKAVVALIRREIRSLSP